MVNCKFFQTGDFFPFYGFPFDGGWLYLLFYLAHSNYFWNNEKNGVIIAKVGRFFFSKMLRQIRGHFIFFKVQRPLRSWHFYGCINFVLWLIKIQNCTFGNNYIIQNINLILGKNSICSISETYLKYYYRYFYLLLPKIYLENKNLNISNT